ncbi:MBL fold metallo-hydrolase [Streptomyces kunmingensis]|uniref:MBL fold metallo-hydrolase n=1 Tax=Streptomyces kunmingensis TaxID=68225 RepID=A0ABU6CJM5_9ACTN|nr:MBL fold metallo-hydrolase [Streptomyces kunmingensis]MEB3964431.1 MBL fold metallo-hydrolase [Streptomyces kunmingensis]
MRIAPHVYRLGNDLVACYLVDTPEGITLIDAGLPGHWRDLQLELRSLGKSVEDIRGLVLTHGDSDHIGFAERLRSECGVPVFVHAADAVRARTGKKPKTPAGPMRLGPALSFFGYSLRKNALRTRYIGEVTEVEDGAVLDLPGKPVIVGMPGHSPGSVAVHVPLADAVFVGDALTTRHVLTGRSGPQPAPFTDDPAEADLSLDRIARLEASWVLPGHGTPWRVSPAEVGEKIRKV